MATEYTYKPTKLEKLGTRRITKVSLSQKGVDTFIMKLEDARDTFLFNSKDRIEKLADGAVDVAKQTLKNNLSSPQYSTGRLNNSITRSNVKGVIEDGKVKFKCTISANMPYAKFVEFGTGVKGKASGYPSTSKGTLFIDGPLVYDETYNSRRGSRYYYVPQKAHRYMLSAYNYLLKNIQK